MTVNELVYYCEQNGISLDTHIAVRAKDDYLVTEDRVHLKKPYFGNDYEGTLWEKENLEYNEEEESLDWDSMPDFIILDSTNN